MLLLNGHKSHISAAFNNYCKSNNIITLCLLPYSFYLTQPLDIRYFSVFKRVYSRQIEDFIRVHFTYITKVEFLLVFKTTYQESITIQNTQAGFYRAGLIPFDP